MQSQMKQWLKDWLGTKTNWSRLVASIAKKWLEDGDGLQDRGITRDLDWGIPVLKDAQPWPGMEGKVFYVWFDAPIAYIGATLEWAEETGKDWKCWWREDQGADQTHYVQFMAKDNIPFHTLSFPATIMGSGEPWKKVDHIKGFNWLTYAGGKFSTSQKRGVFMDQALEILPADYWRWWLLSHAPESGDSDFTWESLRDTCNKDLADNLGNFVHRTLSFMQSRYDGIVPHGPYPPGECTLENELAKILHIYLKAYEANMDSIQFRYASAQLRDIWSLGNMYLHQAEPWKDFAKNSAQAALTLRTCVNLIRIYAIISAPFIPATSKKILEMLNLDSNQPWPDIIQQDLTFLDTNHKISVPKPLFTKITDEQIETWQLRFGGSQTEKELTDEPL